MKGEGKEERKVDVGVYRKHGILYLGQAQFPLSRLAGATLIKTTKAPFTLSNRCSESII